MEKYINKYIAIFQIKVTFIFNDKNDCSTEINQRHITIKISKRNLSIEKLAHEIFHAITYIQSILYDNDPPGIGQDDEPYAYLIEYLTKIGKKFYNL